MDHLAELQAKLSQKTALVGVVGLGYVGLPLAVEFGAAGLQVIGFDIDPDKVESLRRGESYLSDVPSDRVAALVQAGRLEATTDFDRLGEPDALCICVPTPLTATRDPDLAFVIATTEEIAKRLKPGQLVVLESTTYPGTTREEVLPRLAATGLEVGRDFFCGYSPERVNPGARDHPFGEVPRIVSGITPACLQVTQALYDTIMSHTVPVSSPEVAEMAKLLENIFRATNISLQQRPQKPERLRPVAGGEQHAHKMPDNLPPCPNVPNGLPHLSASLFRPPASCGGGPAPAPHAAR